MSADKLHYFKRYVSGPAHKSLDGIFYRNDEEAYKDALNKLKYVKTFVVQKAFREKLIKWPKDAEGFKETVIKLCLMSKGIISKCVSSVKTASITVLNL